MSANASRVTRLLIVLALIWLGTCTPFESDPLPVPARWKAGLGGTSDGVPAIGPDGTVYAVAGGSLTALRSQDGTACWSLHLSGLCGPVVGDDGTVYTPAQDDPPVSVSLCAVAPSGSLLWRRRILPTTTVHHPGCAIGADGTIYCALDTFLLAIAPDSTLLWQVPLAGRGMICPPIIGRDGTIYVCSPEVLYAVSTQGTLKWRDTIPERIDNPPIISSDDLICYANNSGELVALDASGQEQWRRRGSIAVVGADLIMRFWRGYDTLCELHPDGTLNTRQTARMGAQVVADDGALYCAMSGSTFIGSVDARLDALNPDGSLRWTFKAVNDPSGVVPALVGPDGDIYLQTNGALYAISDSARTGRCWWPMYQHDAQRTGRARAP